MQNFRLVLKSINIIIFFIFICSFSFGQGYTDKWIFGDNIGIDFSSGSPVLLTNSSMQANEGTTSIADQNGNLLFYSDGDTVWNQMHNPMPNGTNLFGHESATQTVLATKQPGSNSHFYLFTTDAVGNSGTNGLRYSVIDMNLSGGLGDIAAKNVALFAPTSEKLTAVQHSNKFDTWIMTHDYDSSLFVAYLLKSTGIDTIPIISNIEPDFNFLFSPWSASTGQMKFSPDGSLLAVASLFSNYGINIYQFNNTTGIVSNRINISLSSSINNMYGIEFSPNSKVLYLAELGGSSSIVQLDLSNYDSTQIANSVQIIGSSSSTELGQLQLTPTGEIFVCRTDWSIRGDYLGKIEFPDSLGIACTYIDNGFYLGGQHCTFGFPNFIQSYFNPIVTNVNNFENHFCQVIVYPNPANENATFKFNNQRLENFTFKLYDSLGNIVVIVENIKSNWLSINTKYLTKSLYFFQLQTNSQIKFTGKLLLE